MFLRSEEYAATAVSCIASRRPPRSRFMLLAILRTYQVPEGSPYCLAEPIPFFPNAPALKPLYAPGMAILARRYPPALDNVLQGRCRGRRVRAWVIVRPCWKSRPVRGSDPPNLGHSRAMRTPVNLVSGFHILPCCLCPAGTHALLDPRPLPPLAPCALLGSSPWGALQCAQTVTRDGMAASPDSPLALAQAHVTRGGKT